MANNPISKDISREYLHIVSLRVEENEHKLPHDFEARRSTEILRDLERKYGLHPSIKGEEQTETSPPRSSENKL